MKKLNDFEIKKYQVVKNFVPQNVTKLITQTLIFAEADHLYKHNMVPDGDPQLENTMKFDCSPITEALLVSLLPKMEKIVKEKLFPTYSYARVYRNGSILKDHVDRPSCEISVSIQLAAVGVKNENGWGITMGDEILYLADGDGVVYNGIKVRHSRDELFCEPNGFQTQVFCHYVKADGRFARFAYDRRVGPGISRII